MLNMYVIKHFGPLSFRISNCLTDVDNPIGVVEGFFFFKQRKRKVWRRIVREQCNGRIEMKEKGKLEHGRSPGEGKKGRKKKGGEK